MTHCVAPPPDRIQPPHRAALEIITDALVMRCGVRPHYARLTGLDLMDDLHREGWGFDNENIREMFVWAWLLDHGLEVRMDDVRDPDLRVTLDLGAC